MEYGESETLLLFGIGIITVLLAAIIWFFRTLLPFMSARAEIKMELSRSGGKEYTFWKRELKRLYVSLIPIVGRGMMKLIR